MNTRLAFAVFYLNFSFFIYRLEHWRTGKNLESESMFFKTTNSWLYKSNSRKYSSRRKPQQWFQHWFYRIKVILLKRKFNHLSTANTREKCVLLTFMINFRAIGKIKEMEKNIFTPFADCKYEFYQLLNASIDSQCYCMEYGNFFGGITMLNDAKSYKQPSRINWNCNQKQIIRST